MAALQALGIAGFRSYSPECLQKIDFQAPLTLIWGKNGSGKTTIIQVLKYITTGALPPCCDKGKNFVMDPQLLKQSQLVGDARLKFKAFNGRTVLAKRRTLLSINTRGAKLQSLEQTLKTKDEKGELFEINHHCAEIEKQIPQLLGISKAVLENIVFCHQDESLWPFSDNANLKTIFDEMFQTRKTTRILQAYWDKHKQYTKELKENKKALEYLKRLYDEDNRKKRQALSELEKAVEDAEELSKVKQQLAKLCVSSISDASDRKCAIAQRRAVLEEKIHAAVRNTKELDQRKILLAKDYQAASGRPITERKEKTSEEELQTLAMRAQVLQRQRAQLQRKLEESKNTNLLTQKQMELLGEVRRAKQCFPQLKSENNEQEVLRFLKQRTQQMEKTRVELSKLRSEHEKIIIPSLLDLPLSQEDYHKLKRQVDTYSKRLNDCKAQILILFGHLHRPISPIRPGNLNQNAESQLREIHMRLKLKREELANYEGRSPNEDNSMYQLMKLRYSGIEFQKEVVSFCSERMRCFICSKTLIPQDIKNIKARADRSSVKIAKKIQQLQAKTRGEPMRIDPQQMIPILKQEITEAEQAEARLLQQFQDLTAFKKQLDQQKLNENLVRCMRKMGLQKESSQPGFLPPEPTPEYFADRISTYENLRLRLEPMEKSLQTYHQRVARNLEIQQQRRQALQRSDTIRRRIAVCQHETQLYQMACNIHQNLTTLLKNRPHKQKSSSKMKNEPEGPNPQQLEQQLASIAAEGRATTLERQYCLTAGHAWEVDQQRRALIEELRVTQSELKEAEMEMAAERERAQKHRKLQMEYVGKRREVELRGKIAFDQHSRQPDQEYFNKALQLNTKEAIAKELEQYCKAVEASISAYHREKMDEVNKYLAEIWKEVYHGNDIESIEVQANFQEDSKRRKSYSYSIIMQKGSSKMQMKGRCSMGQKVLASIIIRLALAEVFSSSARILTLDEPTTNLDRQHIGNLAHQLCRLIELNQGKYLQMIIISHDLQFIRMMEKYTSSYYEVSRNEKQFSIITKREIKDIYQPQ